MPPTDIVFINRLSALTLNHRQFIFGVGSSLRSVCRSLQHATVSLCFRSAVGSANSTTKAGNTTPPIETFYFYTSNIKRSSTLQPNPIYERGLHCCCGYRILHNSTAPHTRQVQQQLLLFLPFTCAWRSTQPSCSPCTRRSAFARTPPLGILSLFPTPHAGRFRLAYVGRRRGGETR